MALPYTDLFTTGADAAVSTYDASWVVPSGSGAWSVVASTDVLQETTTNVESMCCWTGDQPDADHYVEVIFAASSGDAWIGPAVRCSSSARTYYGIYGRDASWTIMRSVAATWTSLASGSWTLSANDVIRLEVRGVGATVTLRAFKNGTQVGSNVLDSDASRIVAAGRGGATVWTTTSAPSVTSFTVGDLPPLEVVSATATNATDAVPAVSCNLPTRTAGDLLVAWAACDTIGTAISRTQTTEWALLSEEAGANGRLAVLARIATNDASDALSVAAANSNDLSVNVLAVKAAAHGVANVSTDIVLVAAATGSSATADPPSIDGGSVKDWLAMAGCGVDLTASGGVITAVPTGYGDTGSVIQKSASSTTSVALGIGWDRLSAAQTENPAAFANTSGQWIAKTILIPPAVTYVRPTIVVPTVATQRAASW